MTKTISLEITWRGIVSSIVAVLKHGTAQGQLDARKELNKMAALADHANECRQFINKFVEDQMANPDPRFAAMVDEADILLAKIGAKED